MNSKRMENPPEMQIYLSLVQDTLHPPYSSESAPVSNCQNKNASVLWVQSGCIEVNNKPVTAGNGIDLTTTETITASTGSPAVLLRFIVSAEPLSTPRVATETSTCETIFTQQTAGCDDHQ